ncbi:MAG TPA: ATP-binding protein [Burkholderiaceae bacterium]|jgi:signal transduction histidine kinase/DNA-binding response OmpR family regulator
MMGSFFTSTHTLSLAKSIAKLWTQVRHLIIEIRTREWLVLVIGVALSLTVYKLMLAELNDRIDDQFQQDADTINSYMQQRLDTSVNMVIGLQAFSSVNSPITHDAFHKYVASLKLNTYFPGINNLNYAEIVKPEKEALFLQRLAQEYPDAKFATSRPTPERSKSSQFSIAPKQIGYDALILSIIEPDDISTLAIGRNLLSVPAVAKAFYSSIRTGKPTSSGRLIQAMKGKESYIGIAIRVPVYQKGLPTDTEQQREAACIGSVGAGINIESFLDAGNKEGLRYVKYQIFDDALANQTSKPASTLKNLIFDSTYSRTNVNADWPPSIKIRHAAFMVSRALQISGDKSYRVVFTTDGPAVADISLQYPLFAAISVLLITLLVFILLRSSSITTQNAEYARVLADQANIAKGRFLANMSHEIRTPMNAVLGMLSLLMDSNLDNKQSKFASLAYDSAENLMVIINDILDFSKIEAGKLHLEQISFDLMSLIESVMESQEQTAIEKGIKLESHYLSAPTGPLVGDPTRIRQVLINLANNAIKFTAKGRVVLQVEARNDAQDNCLLSISVTDTGIGLAPEKIHEIFDEFTQADESTTREYGGTGLGLSICKSLIEMMGGRISVVSQLGQGSSFTFTLNLPYSAKSISPQVIPTAAEANRPHVSFKGTRILVAEDNKANQIVITHMLKALGCAVDVASDGQQAVDMHEANHYDLVLMDCQMPTLDGFDATSRIRAAEDETTKTPIIALTAHTLPENKEKCLQAGMDDFISKPVMPATLHNVLMQWLKSHSTVSHPMIENGMDYKSSHFIEVRNMIGSAAFDEAASVFINEFAPQKLAELRKAIHANDLSEVSSISHVITGSASILGANLLSELCRDVEQQTKKHEGLKNADAKITAIEVEYRLIEAQIRTILAKDPSI